jgi:hypothetical protein
VLIYSERKALVAGGWFVLREKYCWLVADKPSEQAVCICVWCMSLTEKYICTHAVTSYVYICIYLSNSYTIYISLYLLFFLEGKHILSYRLSSRGLLSPRRHERGEGGGPRPTMSRPF